LLYIVDKGGDLPDSLAGRVDQIILYPQKRISLAGVKFPSIFRSYEYSDYRDPKAGGYVYYDKFGLRYVVYSKDTADGRFHAGDLAAILYGASDDETEKLEKEKYRNEGTPPPNKSFDPNDR
jgi:hypothetical protein